MNIYKKLDFQGIINLHALFVFVLVISIVGGAGYGVYAADHLYKTAEQNASTNTKGLVSKAPLNGINSQQMIAAIHSTATGGASISARAGTSQTSSGSIKSNNVTTSQSENTTGGSNSVTSTSNPSEVGPPTQNSSSSSTSTATYLVTGTFLESPTRPTCSPSIPCTAPIANHEVVVNPYCNPNGSSPCGTKPLITTMTNSQGQFTLHLSINHYTLTLNPAVGLGGQSWSFDEIGQSLQLQLTDKTGIQ